MKRNARILLYSSDPAESDHASRFLEKRDYKVLTCKEPAEALALARTEKLDIVLLDLALNELQGGEIIREAKAKNPDVSVILIGSDDDISKNPHLLMFAGYEYIRKPLSELLCVVLEQKLNQQHLYRVSSAVTITRDLHEILDTLLESVIDEVGGDNGAVLLKDEASDSLRLQASRGLPAGLSDIPCIIDESDVLFLVLANNEPIVLHGGYVRLPFLPVPLSRGISSSICAPIRIGGKTLGLLNINWMKTLSPFCQSELRTVEIVALQAAVAIQNARAHQHALERQKLQQEMLLARSIQQHLLPKVVGDGGQIEIEFKSIPASYIGGDFYDFIKFGKDRFGLAIGDVAGKGIPGVRAISSLRLHAQPERDPAEVLEYLNNDLLESSTRGMYATVLYSVLDFSHMSVSFANAGHPPLLVRNRHGILYSPDSMVGIPLGILKNSTYQTDSLAFPSGSTLFLYTDGVIEAKNKQNQEFSMSRLKASIEKAPAGATECANFVLEEVERFTGGLPQHDDITFLAIQAKADGGT
jgi:sigma-B regulation protein RsbU (phosphoserine phosphatase)